MVCLITLNSAMQLLGRAENLADYIRTGANSCFIEITLSGGGQGGTRDHVLRRDIKAVRGDGEAKTYDSSWQLQGQFLQNRTRDSNVKCMHFG